MLKDHTPAAVLDQILNSFSGTWWIDRDDKIRLYLPPHPDDDSSNEPIFEIDKDVIEEVESRTEIELVCNSVPISYGQNYVNSGYDFSLFVSESKSLSFYGDQRITPPSDGWYPDDFTGSSAGGLEARWIRDYQVAFDVAKSIIALWSRPRPEWDIRLNSLAFAWLEIGDTFRPDTPWVLRGGDVVGPYNPRPVIDSIIMDLEEQRLTLRGREQVRDQEYLNSLNFIARATVAPEGEGGKGSYSDPHDVPADGWAAEDIRSFMRAGTAPAGSSLSVIQAVGTWFRLPATPGGGDWALSLDTTPNSADLNILPEPDIGSVTPGGTGDESRDQNLGTNSTGLFVVWRSGAYNLLGSSLAGVTAAVVDAAFTPAPPPPVPALVISDINPSIDEGTTETINIRLAIEPSADVVVMFSDDTDFTTPSPQSLTFTTTDWNVEQDVHLTARNDNAIGNIEETILVSCVGGGYDSVIATIMTTSIDTDVPEILISSSDPGSDGRDVRVNVRLNVQPTGNVVVTFSDNPDVFGGGSRTYTPNDWATDKYRQFTGTTSDYITVLVTCTAVGGGFDGVSGSVNIQVRF